MERDAAVKEALNYIKKCPYKGTAIKIELEAQLSRPTSGSECGHCNGSGDMICPDCDDGVFFDDQSHEQECVNCDGLGETNCNRCDGEGRRPNAIRWTTETCQTFMHDNVSKKARKALIYSQFYDDGSVDSEFTFTLPLDKAPLAVEFIKAFKKLSLEIGNGLDTRGAGMHIAILNSKRGTYPSGNSLNTRRANNFKRSMRHLLPALFFLGSCDDRSRSLRYRQPDVNLEDKPNAITGHRGVFEYRLFETCYDRPEAIFDHICVIAKTLQFYRLTPKELPFFGDIGRFDFVDGQGLSRFYYAEVHLKALEVGVKVLKPDYKSMQLLRRERKFHLSSDNLEAREKRTDAKLRQEYKASIKRVKERLVEQEKIASEEWEHAKKNSDATQWALLNERYGRKSRWVSARTSNLRDNLRRYATEESFISEIKKANQPNVYATLVI